MASWTISEYAAWWGASVATVALIWNIVLAIRSGPRIRVTISSNFQVMPHQPPTNDATFVFVTAVNVGSAPTTITHFVGYFEKEKSQFPNPATKQHFAVPNPPVFGKGIPCVLQPGDQWTGLAEQDGLQNKASGRPLYLGVIHNQRKKAVYKRVRFG